MVTFKSISPILSPFVKDVTFSDFDGDCVINIGQVKKPNIDSEVCWEGNERESYSEDQTKMQIANKKSRLQAPNG